MSVRIVSMGFQALLVEVDDSLPAAHALRAVMALAQGLGEPPAGVRELVPAARTLLVHFDPGIVLASRVREWITQAVALPHPLARVGANASRTLEVTYDGEDLLPTAELLGMSAETLVARQTSAQWTVAFTGFAPGFGYLVSDDWNVDVPRRESPRTRVPAGSVGLAAGFAGVYPRATPGGWQLIGSSAETLFDPAGDPPVLLTPGVSVRFVAVRPQIAAGSRGDDGSSGSNAPHPPSGVVGSSGTSPAVEVIAPGLLTTIQDRGRPGVTALGIARSGALDRGALRIANRLVGNDVDAAALEITMGGFRARAHRDVWIAVTGAMAPLRLAGHAADPGTAHLWRAGQELALDTPDHGVRTYLALRGGVEADRVVGSRATDLMSGLGPRPLAAGALLRVGSATAGPVPVIDFPPWGAPQDDELVLSLEPGARSDWFTREALATLYDAVWTVTADANRSGVRLDGPELVRTTRGELPSEGMVVGAIQVPPAGHPTVLLADGPVTGGYPVIAVVADASVDALAQARPGTRVRFRHSVAR